MSRTGNISVILLFTCLILLPKLSLADLQFDIPVFATQPDGQKLELRASGDEFFQTTESMDGYTVTRDPLDGWICYARLSPDRTRLISTGARVGRVSPRSLGLSPHLRISEEAVAATVNRARARLAAGIAENQKALGTSTKSLSTGNVVGITLLIDFSDEVGTITPTEVDNYCNQIGYSENGNNGSVHDYFFDVSDGLLTYTNDVVPAYYRANNPKSWYEDTTVPAPERAQILVLEALNDLEANGFDFSNYDSNGDGIVDGINIFYAGFRGSTWAAGLWPHRSSVNFEADGVSIRPYQITDMRDYLRLATFCHENGHMLCDFPDLYDYGGESRGVGRFCLMCDSASSTNPVEVSAPLKRYANWTTDHELTGNESGLSAVAGVNDVFIFDNSNTVTTSEYYVIENRHQSGRDAELPDEGLAMWHVDEKGSNNNEQMTHASHYEVTLVQADGLWDLENDLNRGDSDDLWSSPTYPECTPLSTPPTSWWAERVGSLSGLGIINISSPGSVMTFDFEFTDWSADCNYNGVDDALDISGGTSLDINFNGKPDECEYLMDEIHYYDPVSGQPDSPYASIEITITGVVYAAKGTLTPDDYFLTDGSGGIRYQATHGAGISLGDTIRLTATPFSFFGGEIFIYDSSQAPAYEVVGHGPEPEPKTFTVSELISTKENVGWFAEVEETVYFVDAEWLFLEQDGDFLVVTIQETTGIDTGFIEVGDVVRIRGACTLENGQIGLWPRFQTDLFVQRVPEPVIAGIEDVEDDQGYQVHLKWFRSGHEAPDDPSPIQEYEVYRLVEPAVSLQENKSPSEEWDLVLNVPASGEEQYSVVAPTLVNSTISGGISYSTFFVRAVTSDPSVYFDSDQVSGYSVDNIAPEAPASLSAAYEFSGVTLDWADATETDFQTYHVYFDTDPAFTPSPDNLLQETEISTWTDARESPWGHFYKVTVLDVAGNESEPGDPVPPLSSAEDWVPARTALLGAVPNPFNPSTRLIFEMAAGGNARVTVYDLAGRLVTTLVDGHRAAGRYEVIWDGRDTGGRKSSAGVYLYRLQANGLVETKRMTMVK